MTILNGAPYIRQQQGVTLIELVIIFVLISILASIGLPGLATLIAKARTNQVSTELVSAIHKTRSLAIYHDHNAMLCPTTNGSDCEKSDAWHKGWLAFIDRNSNRRRESNEPVVLANTVIPTGITVHSSRKTGIIFQSDGRATGSNTTLRICRDAYSQTLVLANSGRLRRFTEHGKDYCH